MRRTMTRMLGGIERRSPEKDWKERKNEEDEHEKEGQDEEADEEEEEQDKNNVHGVEVHTDFVFCHGVTLQLVLPRYSRLDSPHPAIVQAGSY